MGNEACPAVLVQVSPRLFVEENTLSSFTTLKYLSLQCCLFDEYRPHLDLASPGF